MDLVFILAYSFPLQMDAFISQLKEQKLQFGKLSQYSYVLKQG